VEGGKFPHVAGHQHWHEAWRKEKPPHRRLHPEKYRHIQLTHGDTCSLYGEYYIQETHIAWIRRIVCERYMDEGETNKHIQKS
jgi:hypothetical protein